jgi:hypothetical protein
MKVRPTTAPFSRRQTVSTTNGTVLERQHIYLPAATWEALQQLSIASHRSGSQIIESLIEIAARGQLIKDKNDQSNTGKD